MASDNLPVMAQMAKSLALSPLDGSAGTQVGYTIEAISRPCSALISISISISIGADPRDLHPAGVRLRPRFVAAAYAEGQACGSG